MTFTHPKLLTALQAACPELMEPGVGCAFWAPNCYFLRVENNEVVFSDEPYAHERRVPISQVEQKDWLGREPQLRDILIALNEVSEKTNIDFHFDSYGTQFRIWYVKTEPNTKKELRSQWVHKQYECFWNLSLGLYGQDKATLDFLEQLLVTK